MTFELDLPLEYRLEAGWLARWAEALMQGTALARSCRQCGRASFVPERICDCGCSEGSWKPVPGKATVIRRTSGLDGNFGFVRFDGADTCAVVALEGFEAGDRRGELIAPAGSLPKLIIRPIHEEVPD